MKTVSVIIILFFSFHTFSYAQSNCYLDLGFSAGYPGILAENTGNNKTSNSAGDISISIFTNSMYTINLHNSIKFGSQLNYTKFKLKQETDIYFTDENGIVTGIGLINNLSILNVGLPITYTYTKNSKVRYNFGFIPHIRLVHKSKLTNASNNQEIIVPSYIYKLRKANLAAYIGVGFLQKLSAGVDLEITPFAQMNIFSDGYNSSFGSHRLCQVGVAFGFIKSKV
jgi:hypothetical protein